MTHRNTKSRILPAAFSLFLLNSSAAAGIHEIEFDQGVTVEPLLEEVRTVAAEDRSLQRSIGSSRSTEQPPLRMVREIAPLAAPLKQIGALRNVYGPFGAKVTNSSPYRDATSLRADPRYGQLPPHILAHLDGEWTQINSIRGDLLTKVGELDPKDEKLFADGERLNQRKTELEWQRNQLNQDIDDYNRECTGRSLPPDEFQRCSNRRAGLIARRGRLDQAIDEHNSNVEAWNERSRALFGEANNFNEAVSAWERRIQRLIESIKNAFTNPGQGMICELVKPPQVECIWVCPNREVVSLPFPTPGVPESCSDTILHFPRPPASSWER